jgi:hypothetical protein
MDDPIPVARHRPQRVERHMAPLEADGRGSATPVTDGVKMPAAKRSFATCGKLPPIFNGLVSQ